MGTEQESTQHESLLSAVTDAAYGPEYVVAVRVVRDLQRRVLISGGSSRRQRPCCRGGYLAGNWY